jgi:hypothetical protein
MCPTPDTAVPTMQEAETARNTSDANVNLSLLGELVGIDSYPRISYLDITQPEARPYDLGGKMRYRLAFRRRLWMFLFC